MLYQPWLLSEFERVTKLVVNSSPDPYRCPSSLNFIQGRRDADTHCALLHLVEFTKIHDDCQQLTAIQENSDFNNEKVYARVRDGSHSIQAQFANEIKSQLTCGTKFVATKYAFVFNRPYSRNNTVNKRNVSNNAGHRGQKGTVVVLPSIMKSFQPIIYIKEIDILHRSTTNDSLFMNPAYEQQRESQVIVYPLERSAVCCNFRKLWIKTMTRQLEKRDENWQQELESYKNNREEDEQGGNTGVQKSNLSKYKNNTTVEPRDHHPQDQGYHRQDQSGPKVAAIVNEPKPFSTFLMMLPNPWSPKLVVRRRRSNRKQSLMPFFRVQHHHHKTYSTDQTDQTDQSSSIDPTNQIDRTDPTTQTHKNNNKVSIETRSKNKSPFSIASVSNIMPLSSSSISPRSINSQNTTKTTILPSQEEDTIHEASLSHSKGKGQHLNEKNGTGTIVNHDFQKDKNKEIQKQNDNTHPPSMLQIDDASYISAASSDSQMSSDEDERDERCERDVTDERFQTNNEGKKTLRKKKGNDKSEKNQEFNKNENGLLSAMKSGTKPASMASSIKFSVVPQGQQAFFSSGNAHSDEYSSEMSSSCFTGNNLNASLLTPIATLPDAPLLLTTPLGQTEMDTHGEETKTPKPKKKR
eukprot:g3982.t1